MREVTTSSNKTDYTIISRVVERLQRIESSSQKNRYKSEPHHPKIYWAIKEAKWLSGAKDHLHTTRAPWDLDTTNREIVETSRAAFEIALRRAFRKLSGSERVENAVLQELVSLRGAQDEPGFMHSITEDAHKLAKEIIKSAYTQPIGSAPTPSTAPDGDGGVVVEWKSGQREVRLISAASKDYKSYIYSRGAKTAKIDYEISGAILADALRSTFAD
jgi:hypothetical protein